MSAAPATPDTAAASKKPERFIDATRTGSTLDIGAEHAAPLTQTTTGEKSMRMVNSGKATPC
jgi:hypothetical protein